VTGTPFASSEVEKPFLSASFLDCARNERRGS